uniref:protein MRG1-like n=1 Tax=Erigeron canadensis TaxID=72917 RepID=UPI001CB8C0F0|nr:protein MRG1-like [Erigeron canadensis]
MSTDSSTDSDDSAGNRRRVTDVSSKCKFSDGEKVLAYHGPRIYEAKVQKSEIKKKEWKYFVHYLGWSKTWDEWVGADRLMKYTNDNIQKQAALDKKQGVEKNPKSGRSNHMKPKISNDIKVDKEDVKTYGAKGKKRKNDSSNEKESASIQKPVNIDIPSSLKQQLVDDWVFVNVQDKLVNIPRSPNIDDILAKYLEHMSKKDGMMTDSVGEILNGLRCYFDRALPVILLYDKERQQYRDNVSDDVSPSSIYGAEHLLRLFVKLPELLPYVNIEEDLMIHLHKKFLDFLKFLLKNQSSFFLSSYEDSKASETSVASDKMIPE